MMEKIAETLVKKANQNHLKNEGVSSQVYRLIYKGNPPWEISQPQPAIIDIEKDDDFISPVLDIGCGYGENAKFLAEKGYEVLGIDFLPEVIDKAKMGAQFPHLRFEVKDALTLNETIQQYKTFVDSATFHGFSDEHRRSYVKQLRQYMLPGSHLYLIGFSDQEKREGGPRRLSEDEIKAYFLEGWIFESVIHTKYIAHTFQGGAEAIVMKIRRDDSTGE